jgi:hypothetical protein
MAQLNRGVALASFTAASLIVAAGLALSWKLHSEKRALLRQIEQRMPSVAPSGQLPCVPRTDAGALVQRVLQADNGTRQECDCDDRGCCKCY